MYFDGLLCLLQTKVNEQRKLLELMTEKLYKGGFVNADYLTGILEREAKYPTGLLVDGTGFALPHTDSDRVRKSQICFASLKTPVLFADMGGAREPVRAEFVFMIAMSEPHEQAETLQKLVEMFQNKEAVQALKNCRQKSEFRILLEKLNLR